MTDIAAVREAIELQINSAGGPATTFVEVLDNGREVVIGGNRSGLLQLALHLISLAENESQGAHIHMDEHSGVDVSERPLILRKSNGYEA